MRAFITSQFSYCPLVWMCHSRTVNNKINKLQERGLLLVYNDRQSTFEELLDKGKSFSIHHRNFPVLATEMYKVYSNVAPAIMNDIFEKKKKKKKKQTKKQKDETSYNLKRNYHFIPRNIKSVY